MSGKIEPLAVRFLHLASPRLGGGMVIIPEANSRVKFRIVAVMEEIFLPGI